MDKCNITLRSSWFLLPGDKKSPSVHTTVQVHSDNTSLFIVSVQRRELLSAFGAASASARNLEVIAEDMEARFSLSYTDYKKGGAEMIYLAQTGSVPRATFA